MKIPSLWPTLYTYIAPSTAQSIDRTRTSQDSKNTSHAEEANIENILFNWINHYRRCCRMEEAQRCPIKRRISTFPLLLLPSGQQMQLCTTTRQETSSNVVNEISYALQPELQNRGESPAPKTSPCEDRSSIEVRSFVPGSGAKSVSTETFEGWTLGMGVQSVSGGRLNWLGTETLWMSVNGSAQWEIFCGLRLSCWEHDNA